MKDLMNRKRTPMPNIDVIEVEGELNSACALAIVKQLKRSVKRGSDFVVLDFRKTTELSTLGLAVLFDFANTAGVLQKLAFQAADPLSLRFFITGNRPWFEGIT